MLTVLYLVFLSGAIVRALRENVFAAFVFSLRFGFCSEFQVYTLVCNYWQHYPEITRQSMNSCRKSIFQISDPTVTIEPPHP